MKKASAGTSFSKSKQAGRRRFRAPSALDLFAKSAKAGRALAFAAVSSLAVAGLSLADDLTFHLVVEGGRTVGGAPTLRAVEGDTVEIVLESDDGLELHLHGYDLTVPLAPGEPASLAFAADRVGRFPAESHGHGDGHHETLFYLEIYPQ